MFQQTLYQIGTLPVFSDPPVYLDGSVEVSAEPALYISSDRVMFPTTPISRASPKQYTVEIRLFSNSLFTVDQYLSTLKSFAKRKIDFFSYVDLDDMPEVAFYGDEDPRSTTGLVWFHSEGAIQSIIPSTDADTGEMTVSVTFFVETYWNVVNRLEWVWRAGQFNPFNTTTTASILAAVHNYQSTFPDRQDIAHVSRHGRVWAKRNIINGSNSLDWMLTFTMWPHIVSRRSWAKPPVGYYGTMSTGDDDEFTIESSVYSGGASSLYAISPMSQFGVMTLTIESVIDGYTIDTDLVTIDFAALNTEMSNRGYGSSQSTDVLYFGDWPIQPGFLVRDGQIVTVRPTINHSREFAGQLAGYQNKLTLGLDGTTMAPGYLKFLHLLRRE